MKNVLIKVKGNKMLHLVRYVQYLNDSGYWEDKNWMHIPCLNYKPRIKKRS